MRKVFDSRRSGNGAALQQIGGKQMGQPHAEPDCITFTSLNSTEPRVEYLRSKLAKNIFAVHLKWKVDTRDAFLLST